jgi:hypothetical protein
MNENDGKSEIEKEGIMDDCVCHILIKIVKKKKDGEKKKDGGKKKRELKVMSVGKGHIFVLVF